MPVPFILLYSTFRYFSIHTSASCVQLCTSFSVLRIPSFCFSVHLAGFLRPIPNFTRSSSPFPLEMESRRPRLPLQASAPVPVYIFFLLPVLYSALTTLRLPQIVHGFLLKIHAVQMVHQPVHKPVQRDNCSPPELSDLLRSATGNMAVYLCHMIFQRHIVQFLL